LAILAALVDLISHVPTLLFIGFLVLLGFHRSRKVAGKKWWIQLSSYIGLLVVMSVILFGVHVFIKQRSAQFVDEFAAKIAKAVTPKRDAGSAPTATQHGADKKQESLDARVPRAAERREAVSTPEKKPCHVENGQLVDCTDSEIVDWGRPILQRLNEAIQDNVTSMDRRLHKYQNQNDPMASSERLLEIVQLNRYLEKDYRNFVIYRAAVISRLNGGDPNPSSVLMYLAAQITREGGLSDQFSNLSQAQFIYEDLQDVSNRLARQAVKQPS